MHSVRTSIDSFWKVGKKRGWWKGVEGGDVLLFVVGLALMNRVYDRRKEAIDRGIGNGLGWMRGDNLFAKRSSDERREKLR